MKLLVVLGTRPEAIKLCPLIRAIDRDPRFEGVVVTTGQHREMLDQVLELFEVVPHHDLNLLRSGQTLTDLTVLALAGLQRVIDDEAPGAVVVQGDTTTTFVGALSAFYAGVPCVHVEAGLRTGDLSAPFPEEGNRCLTTQLSALHLAPTNVARANLLAEGVEPQDIVVTGNTGIDALKWAASRAGSYGDDALEDLDRDPRRVVVVTAHRREAWDGGLTQIGAALGALARRYEDVRFVFPIHRNPRVRSAIRPHVEGLGNVDVIEPLPYAAMARLLQRSTLVLTDSGGLQEEAPSLGKPVLVMRDTTERPEGIEAGVARLVGMGATSIVRAVATLLDDAVQYARMGSAVSPYGDGRAVERCIAAIAQRWCRTDHIEDPVRVPAPSGT